MRFFDPYDVWATPHVGQLKQFWYRGSHVAGVLLSFLYILDWMAPHFFRRCMKVQPAYFPHVESMLFCLSDNKNSRSFIIDNLKSTCSPDGGWGLPFTWFSKNGTYAPSTSFVTNTPYVMEALLCLANNKEAQDDALDMFYGTWRFLESLNKTLMTSNQLALSYAPVKESRLVINANSYAALAFALHALHGKAEVREDARNKVLRLLNWVVAQQETDGRWWYYADREPGNFIDCFHSCFVVKNLVKVKRLLPEYCTVVDGAVIRGWQFIRDRFYDPQAGLCRRFVVRSHHDSYRWDLYDQAEYLGLLLDFNMLEDASTFAKRVEQRFKLDQDWYCRIDIFGQRWGRNFIRWGIAPFLFHLDRLKCAVKVDQ